MAEDTKDVVVTTPTALVKAFGEGEVNTGFEGTKGTDYAIPFLNLLQKGSPQCDPDDPAYNPDRFKVGQFYDEGRDEVLDSVRVIPCHFKAVMVEVQPGEQGNFVATHDPGVEVGLPKDEKGRYVMPSGNLLIDTRQHFVLRLTDSGLAVPMVISFRSSQIKKSRNWMTKMDGIRAQGKNGPFRPPMYATVWKITSVPESNDKGSWRGYIIEQEGPIVDPLLFEKAKEANQMFLASAGLVKPKVDATPF